jgi:hypothetical protein
MAGSQLYVHLHPRGRFDPYVGVAPGFRFGFTTWTPYVAGVPQPQQSEMFPAIVIGARGGLNYHPRPDFAGWQVGAYLEASITALGDEVSQQFRTNNNDKGVQFVSLLGGLRSTVAF